MKIFIHLLTTTPIDSTHTCCSANHTHGFHPHPASASHIHPPHLPPANHTRINYILSSQLSWRVGGNNIITGVARRLVAVVSRKQVQSIWIAIVESGCNLWVYMTSGCGCKEVYNYIDFLIIITYLYYLYLLFWQHRPNFLITS